MSGFPLVAGIILVLLVAVLIVLRNNKKKDALSGAAKISPVGETSPQAPEEAPAEAAAAVEEDADVVAVIAAAVAALSKQAVVIRVITRIPGMQAPSWSLAGRQDTMSLRQQ